MFKNCLLHISLIFGTWHAAGKPIINPVRYLSGSLSGEPAYLFILPWFCIRSLPRLSRSNHLFCEQYVIRKSWLSLIFSSVVIPSIQLDMEFFLGSGSRVICFLSRSKQKWKTNTSKCYPVLLFCSNFIEHAMQKCNDHLKCSSWLILRFDGL